MDRRKMLIAIAAIQPGGGIGKAGKLLAHVPSDLAHFKETTMGSAVIMGRKTWESLPNRHLPGRLCIVLSRSDQGGNHAHDVAHVSSKEAALKLVADLPTAAPVFVAGGAEIYEQFINDCDRLILTELLQQTQSAPDAFFPEVSLRQWGKESIRLVREPGEPVYYVITYLNLVQEEID